MHKSTNDSTNDASHVVSRLNVGQRVLVSGRFGGVLRYVGKVIAKDGIFCGVELDQPIGKHDGTYRNITYFECRSNHGIFAPTYKVQLESTSCTSIDKNLIKRPNKLIKSAIPSLAPTNTMMNNSGLSKKPMDWSLMSTTSSSAMDSSFALSENDNYDYYENFGMDNDMMMQSNHTYTVTDTDCLMLSDIEICDSNLIHLDDDDDYENDYLISANRNVRNLLETSQSTSVILEQSTVDPSLLPIICGESSEEEMDLPTPMVDDSGNYGLHNTISNNNIKSSTLEAKNISEIQKFNDNLNHNNLINSENIESNDSENANGISTEKQNNSKKKNSTTNNKISPIKTTTTTFNNSHNSKKFETSLAKSADLNGKTASTTDNKNKKNEQREKSPPSKIFTSNSSNSPKIEKKKTRLSVRELMETTAKPTIIRAPKPPSKNQLMMERLKASIEAEKNRPAKKEVQSKVAASLIRVPPPQPEQEVTLNDENCVDFNNSVEILSDDKTNKDEMKTLNNNGILTNNNILANKFGSNSSLSSKSALKNSQQTNIMKKTPTSNSTVLGANPTTTTTVLGANPTTTVLGANPTTTVLGANPTTTDGRIKVGAKNTSFTNSLAKLNYSLKNKTGQKVAPTTTTNESRFGKTNGCSTNLPSRPPSQTSNASSAPRLRPPPQKALVWNSSNKSQSLTPKSTTNKKVLGAENSVTKKIEETALISQLQKQLIWNGRAAEVFGTVLRFSVDNNELKANDYKEKLIDLESRLEREKKFEFEVAQNQFKAEFLELQKKHNNELEAFKNENLNLLEAQKANLIKYNRQKEISDSLNNRIVELEDLNSALKKDLEHALSENDNEKIKKYLSDISSLKFELECKSEKLKEMRIENQNLQLRVDEIPLKETEIQKLKHRLSDLKLELNQQREIHKVMTAQMEEIRRDAKNTFSINEALAKENDMLKYRLEEGMNMNSSPRSSLINFNTTGGTVFRTPMDEKFTSPANRHSATSMYYSAREATPHPIHKFDDPMTKSWDAGGSLDRSLISIYQEQGRTKRTINTPTKIYAPNGTFEVDEDTPRKPNNQSLKVSFSEMDAGDSILEADEEDPTVVVTTTTTKKDAKKTLPRASILNFDESADSNDY